MCEPGLISSSSFMCPVSMILQRGGERERGREGARAIDDERLDNDETCYPAGTVWVVSSCAQHLHALDLYS